MLMGAPLDETKKARLDEALGWFETILKGRTYVAANHFTVADISITVTVSQIEAYGYDLGPYSRVRAWFERCKDELEEHGYQV